MFGEWVMASDKLAHYYLNGKPSCGSKSAARHDEPIPLNSDSLMRRGVPCPKCKQAQAIRWAGLKTLTSKGRR